MGFHIETGDGSARLVLYNLPLTQATSGVMSVGPKI